MQNKNTEEFAVGLAAVQAAARLCEAVRLAMVVEAAPGVPDAHWVKQDQSPVTVADFGAQAIVCHMLGSHFPMDTIVAEEDSSALQDAQHADQLASITRFVAHHIPHASPAAVCEWIDRGKGDPHQRFWVLDPIDGTKGFLRRDQYAVALALIEDGTVKWGFLACPVLKHAHGAGAIFLAQQNHGVEMFSVDGMLLGPVQVSSTLDPGRGRVVESVESAHTNSSLSSEMQQRLGITAAPMRMDSQAKYAVIAQGGADIYLRAPNTRTPDYRERIWDHAAGWLVVTEAGGRVTDVYGAELDWTQGRRLEHNTGVVATNGQLHTAVLEALHPHLPRDAHTP